MILGMPTAFWKVINYQPNTPAQANQRKAVGRTLPLHEAAKHGSVDVVIRLLSAGKEAEVWVTDMLGRQNAEGDTATPTTLPRDSPTFLLLLFFITLKPRVE